MNDKQLTCFLTVAEELNFSRTAQKLFMSQPAVTHQIATLEKELGFTLFERNYHNVTLTPGGAAFALDCSRLSEAMEQAIRHAQHIARRSENLITISHYSPEGDGIFYEAISAFSQQYAPLEAQIHLPQASRILDSLLNGDLDAALLPQVLLTEQEEVEYVKLFTAPEYAVMSRRHQLAGKKSLTLKDMEDTVCLIGPDHVRLRSWHEMAMMADPDRYQLQESGSLRERIANLRARSAVIICIYPMLFIDSGLVRIPFEDGQTTTTCLCWKKGNNRTNLQKLVSFFQNYYQNSQP